jgi:D-3-phosphoglycerate dehydrogenase
MANINKVLAKYNLNVNGQFLSTDPKVGYVITDLDKEYSKEVLKELREIEGTIRFRVLY